MTPPPPAATGALTGARLPDAAGTYARARLRLGIAGVGLLVTASATVLATGVPEGWVPAIPGPLSADVGALISVLAAFALLQAPLDVLGGWWLPRRHGRPTPTFTGWFVGWTRGVLVQMVVLLALGAALLAAARSGGTVAALAAAAGGMLALLAAQPVLARVVGGLRRSGTLPSRLVERLRTLVRDPVGVSVWSGRDVGFTGGWLGLPGRETLVVPEHWLAGLSDGALGAVVVRRAGALPSRRRGVLVAMAFLLGGLALASLLPGADFATVAGLVRIALAMTIWSFVGLLVLPSLSRPAVFAADAYGASHGVSRLHLEEVIRRLDRWQDDEPRRARVVETIFHPVPSVEARLAALDAADGGESGSWHTARTMLYLSWAGLGLLSRAVHCNSGRPELWVALPAD